MGEGKLKRTFQSRKIWIGLIAFVVLLALYLTSAIDASQFAMLVTVIGGVLAGAISFEDGLSALLNSVDRRDRESDEQ